MKTETFLRKRKKKIYIAEIIVYLSGYDTWEELFNVYRGKVETITKRDIILLILNDDFGIKPTDLAFAFNKHHTSILTALERAKDRLNYREEYQEYYNKVSEKVMLREKSLKS